MVLSEKFESEIVRCCFLGGDGWFLVGFVWMDSCFNSGGGGWDCRRSFLKDFGTGISSYSGYQHIDFSFWGGAKPLEQMNLFQVNKGIYQQI